jgi:hypothetical protein
MLLLLELEEQLIIQSGSLTSKYTTIKSGQNRITTKYECEDNPASKSFSSVNVTGINQ